VGEGLVGPVIIEIAVQRLRLSGSEQTAGQQQPIEHLHGGTCECGFPQGY
jgi:hypothetical protein